MIEVDIEKLIIMPKKITESSSKEFSEEYQHFRRDFKHQSIDGNYKIRMFIRKHKEFQENFSIGLVLLPSPDKGMPLIRFNGPHYVTENLLKPDPHYEYHIHVVKKEDIERDIRKLSFAEITDKYNSYEEALSYFIKRTNIINANEYFNLQKSLFGDI